jgi:hypothetical protein
LFENGIFPPLISAESHRADVYALLVALGGYRAFKLVEGKRVTTQFARHTIATSDGPRAFDFPSAAGPFGDDLPGDWLNPEAFFRYHALRGFGWMDIHASRIHTPNEALQPSFVDYLIEAKLPGPLQAPALGAVRALRRLCG